MEGHEADVTVIENSMRRRIERAAAFQLPLVATLIFVTVAPFLWPVAVVMAVGGVVAAWVQLTRYSISLFDDRVEMRSTSLRKTRSMSHLRITSTTRTPDGRWFGR